MFLRRKKVEERGVARWLPTSRLALARKIFLPRGTVGGRKEVGLEEVDAPKCPRTSNISLFYEFLLVGSEGFGWLGVVLCGCVQCHDQYSDRTDPLPTPLRRKNLSARSCL